jgi:hypothetical protein
LSPDALKNTGFRNIKKSLEMLKTYLHGQSLEGFDPSSRAGSREYPTPKIISVG